MKKNIFKCVFYTLLVALMISCGNKGNNTSYDPEQTISDDTVCQEQTPEKKLPETSNEPIDPVKAVYGFKPNNPEFQADGVWGKDIDEYVTKRFKTYLESAWDADELYDTQDCYCPDSQPVITSHEANRYIFDIKFTRYNGKQTIRKTVVVAIEDGKWKIDNLLTKDNEYRFDYTISIKKAYQNEGYPDENYEPSHQEVIDSKKVPDFVPEVNSTSERLLHSSK